MKIYILRPKENLKDNPWTPWYDKVFGFIVRAKTEEEARKMANEQGGDETGPVRNRVYRTGGDPWLNPEYSTCEELSKEGEAGVIMRDFARA